MRKFVCIALAMCTVLMSKAQPDSSFHLYILVGQSNMAGRGEITASYRDMQYNNIFMLNKAGDWVPARHPLHFDKPAIAGVGPGLAFAKAMADSDSIKHLTRSSNNTNSRSTAPKVKIGLVPCAVGGSSIRSWIPGGYDSATRTHPFDDAIARIATAGKSGIFMGIIWHQGESDSKPQAASQYLKDLQILVERFRTATRKPALPFVAGELGTFRPAYQLINVELKKLTRTIPASALASSNDLKHKGDSTHFDSHSADELGKRMAEKMIVLQTAGK
ncbi:sialate O-acetylesterase [Flavitalea sp.]|nr:sialate O-acetylesterase [Flavitalea sp.]